MVAAHPDDEVLGCGGTIAAWADRGHEVSILILGEGATARMAGQVGLPEVLAGQARESAHILGAVELDLVGLPDNRFDSVDLLEVVRSVEARIEQIAPNVVLTHRRDDLNIDHEVTARAVITATRPQPGSVVRHVAAFEVPSATEWSFGGSARAFNPGYFMEIGNHLETKVRALETYESEVRDFPHPRSIENVRNRAAAWGAVVGVQAAEAFEVVRSIRLLGDGRRD